MHVRARDDSEVFYKHLKKKFKQVRSVVLPESCRQIEKNFNFCLLLNKKLITINCL